MSVIEKHTPRGIDLADGEGYRAEGPKKPDLIVRVDTIFDRFQAFFSHLPSNLAAISLFDANGRAWAVAGRSNEEGDRIEALSLSAQGDRDETHINLNRDPSNSDPYVEYMSYSESLSERNSELVLSKTETIVNGLLKPFEEKVVSDPKP